MGALAEVLGEGLRLAESGTLREAAARVVEAGEESGLGAIREQIWSGSHLPCSTKIELPVTVPSLRLTGEVEDLQLPATNSRAQLFTRHRDHVVQIFYLHENRGELGSGYLIKGDNPNNPFVLTANHVVSKIKPEEAIHMWRPGATVSERDTLGHVIFREPETDLAVLRLYPQKESARAWLSKAR